MRLAVGERHTLGLICFGLLLAGLGWRIAYLGADTPIDQVAGASASLSPDAVVLCALQPRVLDVNASAIGDLGREHHTILAGAGATAGLARRLGVAHGSGDPLTLAQSLAEDPPGTPAGRA